MTTDLSISEPCNQENTWKYEDGTPRTSDLSLSDTVSVAVNDYLNCLGEHYAVNLYQMVIDEVESSLLKVVMDFSKLNKTKAAAMLGLNRATLRKKLLKHKLT